MPKISEESIMLQCYSRSLTIMPKNTFLTFEAWKKILELNQHNWKYTRACENERVLAADNDNLPYFLV